MSRASSWRTRPAARTRTAGERHRMAQWPTSHSRRAVPKLNRGIGPVRSDNRLRITTTGCSTGQQVATHCNRLQITATGCNSLQQVAAQDNRLQITATGCKSLQQVAAQDNRLQITATGLQITATGCNSLQQVAAQDNRSQDNRLQLTATGCSTAPFQSRPGRAGAFGQLLGYSWKPTNCSTCSRQRPRKLRTTYRMWCSAYSRS